MTTLLSTFTSADAIFIASGLFGMVVHYTKRYAKNETSSSLVGYFGKDNLRSTLTTFGAFAMAIITAMNSGVITPDMNLWAVLYAGMTTGFAIDSGFNTGNEAHQSEPAA